MQSLNLVFSYLTNRKTKTKINDNFSSESDLLFGVPQGSILGPLIFNIYLVDMFFICENIDVTSYADDTTPYTWEENMTSVISKIEITAKQADYSKSII